MKQMIIIFLLFSLTSCAQFLERRSFIDTMDKEDDLFVANRDFPVVPGDSGSFGRSEEEIMGRTPASYRSKEDFERKRSLQTELERKEAGLSEHERVKYRQAQSVLQTESERIYYLGLNPSERQHYLQTRVADDEPYSYSKRHRPLSLMEERAVESPRLNVGMSKEKVKRMMGQPARVDVAGNPAHENERWLFSNGRSRSYIYFEGGQVHGWVFE